MKILIVNNMAPFVWGGAEEMAANLEKQLILAGHQAETLRIPFQWEPSAKIPSQMLMVRSLELFNVDRVIALKFPAYLIRHPHKILWVVHQYRQAYDMYDNAQSNLPMDSQGDAIRKCIIEADQQCFNEASKIFTISSLVSERLKKYNNIDSKQLELPVNDIEQFINLSYDDYILSSGRINRMKRQHLLVEAIAQTKHPVKLLIAGPPDSDEEANRLNKLVLDLGLTDRVRLDLRFLPRPQYIDYVNRSLAVACVPLQEDYGYVAREAACAEKALVATTDSGCILEMAQHRRTGIVAEPTATALANALDSIWENRTQTIAYGRAAKALYEAMGHSWSKIIGKLLQ